MGKYLNPRYREERIKRHRQAVRAYLGAKCAKCGVPDRLEVDHIKREDKNFNFSVSYGKSMKRLLKEASKCQLLCKDCHVEKTVLESTGYAEHGSPSYYTNHGCRCDDCRKSWNSYRRSYRARLKLATQVQ